jgi:CRP-like cAMP-binding protein
MLEEAPPRGLGERLLALGRFMRLAPLPARELSRLARLAREREVPAGDRLAALGETVRVVQFVASGKVTLSRGGGDFLTVEAPNTIGLLPLAAGMPFPFDARATEPVHLLEVDADVLADLLEDDFDFFLRILRQGAEAVSNRWGNEPALAVTESALAVPGDPVGPLGAAERLLALRNTDLFRRCPVDGLAAFAKQLEDVRMAEGDELVPRAGELVVLVRGRAAVAGFADRPAVAVRAGSVLGAVESLAEKRSGYLLRAATSLHLLRGTAADLLDTLEDHHAMGRRLLAELLALLVRR